MNYINYYGNTLRTKKTWATTHHTPPKKMPTRFDPWKAGVRAAFAEILHGNLSAEGVRTPAFEVSSHVGVLFRTENLQTSILNFKFSHIIVNFIHKNQKIICYRVCVFAPSPSSPNFKTHRTFFLQRLHLY